MCSSVLLGALLLEESRIVAKSVCSLALLHGTRGATAAPRVNEHFTLLRMERRREWSPVHTRDSCVGHCCPHHTVGRGSEPEPVLAALSQVFFFLLLLLPSPPFPLISNPDCLLPISRGVPAAAQQGLELPTPCLELNLPELPIFKDPSWKLSMASVQSN